jgi:hypothetical protein
MQAINAAHKIGWGLKAQRVWGFQGRWNARNANVTDQVHATDWMTCASNSTLTKTEERNLGREGQPSANSNEFSGSSSGGGERDDDGEYYANMGDALRVLRDDVPQLFHNDVVFTDGRLEFQGLKNYKIIFWSLRFHGKLFFRHTNVDILRIWQPEDYQIKMRWKIVGIPRVGDVEGVIDGISTYKLDRRGKIYEHSITNVQLRDPPLENPLLYGWNWQYFPESQPQLGGLTPGG